MIRYFAAHPTAANLLMAVILVLGITALPTIKRETFPDIAPDEIEVEVVTTRLGAKPCFLSNFFINLLAALASRQSQ